MNKVNKIMAFSVLLLSLILLASCNNKKVETENIQGDIPIVRVSDAAAGAPGSDALVGKAWWVEDIMGGGVVDRSRTTIGFSPDGTAAGNGGCNRFTGGYELNGGNISFGPLASTMMACPEALMNQDRSFHEALDQVTGWRVDAQTGLLHLENDAGETVIRASSLPEGEEA